MFLISISRSGGNPWLSFQSNQGSPMNGVSGPPLNVLSGHTTRSIAKEAFVLAASAVCCSYRIQPRTASSASPSNCVGISSWINNTAHNGLIGACSSSQLSYDCIDQIEAKITINANKVQTEFSSTKRLDFASVQTARVNRAQFSH